MAAYYNEYDAYAAQWLRNLIASKLIPNGDVDERSITEVEPQDLKGYRQCHLFAGIGVWPYALRKAGWSDDRRIWTGSCPCQPFSSAGKGDGFADERHLWPAWHRLIAECDPAIVLGEQVASKAVDPWIDLVHADVEALDYAFGCVAFSAAGCGAPNLRDRAYWTAIKENLVRNMANANSDGRVYIPTTQQSAGLRSKATDDGSAVRRKIVGADYLSDRFGEPGPTNGFWRDADWLKCRDGKWRAVESGTFPLAYGVANGVGQLRAYGNALNAVAAQAWIETVMETLGDLNE
jgi:DNA (cytosine-5)-methyltransferase 1